MRSILQILGVVALAASGVALATWTVGHIASDRWMWSQYLSWVPSAIVLPAAGLLWLLAFFSTWFGRLRWRNVRRATKILGVWILLVGAHWGLVDCRIYRFPRPPRPAGPHVRVLNWNVTAVEQLDQVTVPVQAQRPDIAFLVNPNSHVGWERVAAAFGAEYRYVNIAGFVVISRVAVVRYGMSWLGLDGLPLESDSEEPQKRGWTDPGRAMFIEFDTTASLGRRTVFWIVDLPSEPHLGRWKLCSDAAAVIQAWSGSVSIVEGGGVRVEAWKGHGFPKPDVVLGDFNTPRGSASLSFLAPGMRNAYDEVGAGYSATWPRYGYHTPIPLLQLDQIFVGDGLRAARYEVVDPGSGYHQMQVGDLVGK